MAHRSGFSHAAASALLLVAGAVLVEYIKPKLPWLFHLMEAGAAGLCFLVRRTIHVDVPPQVFVPIAVVFVLGFVWGMVYHVARFGKK